MRYLSCILLAACVAVAVAADSSVLFNGKDFSGWKTKASAKAASEPLDGKAEAFKGRFKAADGAIVVDAKVKGDAWIETVKEYEGDVTVHLEFNPGPGCNNDTQFRGIKFDLKKQDIKNLKEGDWNTFEIVVTGNKAEYKCNGETIKTLDTKAPKSTFALRAEAGPIQVRKLEVKSGK